MPTRPHYPGIDTSPNTVASEFAHLDAHIQMAALLTDQEIHAYQRLRGYAETAGEGHRHQDM